MQLVVWHSTDPLAPASQMLGVKVYATMPGCHCLPLPQLGSLTVVSLGFHCTQSAQTRSELSALEGPRGNTEMANPTNGGLCLLSIILVTNSSAGQMQLGD